MKTIVLPVALEDIRRNADWYDGKRQGLGKLFSRAIRAAVKKVRDMPFGYEEVGNGYRAALVCDYPYRIVYRVDGKVIRIAGVIHTSRDRGVLEKRIGRE